MPLCSQVRIAHGDRVTAGESIDISLGGLGVSTSDELPGGAAVTVTVVPGGLSALAGVVRASASQSGDDADSAGRFRLGIAFSSLSERASEQLLTLLAPMNAVFGPIACLAADAPGRERLYQRAFARLAARDFRMARQCITAALAADPENLHYRAFRHRIAAEEALSRGRRLEAARELNHGLAMLPGDDDLLALSASVEAGVRGGRFGQGIRSWVRSLLPSRS